MLSAPEVRWGNTGSWNWQLALRYSDTALRFPLFQHSSMNLFAICLLSVGCAFCVGICKPSFRGLYSARSFTLHENVLSPGKHLRRLDEMQVAEQLAR